MAAVAAAATADADVADAYAVVVSRDDGSWQVSLLPEALSVDLDGLVATLRQQPSGAAFALVNVADEFFVVVRVRGSATSLLLSDVTSAAEWEFAAQVLEALDLEPPRNDELDEVWPAGELGIFADLGMDEMEVGALLSDLDAYADELLSAIARRLGFAEPFERVVDALVD